MISREVLYNIPMNSVHLNPDNPRVNDEAVPEVVKSIQHSDYISPIIVDENNMILAGNTRYKALQYLRYETIPVVVRVAGLTEAQKKRFILADNKAQEFAEWDWTKLHVFGEDLLDDVGFTDAEIDKIMRGGGRTDTEVHPDVREEVDVQPGDIFCVGKHRVICGDSTDDSVYQRLMGDQIAEMVFTDPPYNVDYQGSQNTFGTNRREGIANDNMTEEQFFEFLKSVTKCMLRYCRGCFYICMSSKEIGNLKKAFELAGGHWQANIIWVKNTFTLSRSDWQNQYEPILYGWHGENKNHYFAGWRDEGNVWTGLDTISPQFVDGKTIIRIGEMHLELDGMVTGRVVDKRGMTDIWYEKKPVKNVYHPTEKPVKLCRKAIEASSHRGGLVLDPFLGGGSTMLAAHECGRICYGIELDPRFVDVVLRRMVMIDPELPILKNGQLYDKGKLQ